MEDIKEALWKIDLPFCIFDPDNRLIYFNQRFLAYQKPISHSIKLGMSLEEFILAEAEWRHQYNLIEDFHSWLQNRRDNHIGSRKSIECLQPNGSSIHIETVTTRKGFSVVLLKDLGPITKLRKIADRYALAIKGTNDGLWDWNLETDTVFYSSRWREMLGLTSKEISTSPDEWLNLVHNDDLDRVNAYLEAHLNGRIPKFEIEYRIRRVDDTYLWVLTRGIAEFNSDGKAIRIAGSQTDIADRKIAEQQAIHDALHDSLTGLANRTLFLDRTLQSLARQQRFPTIKFAIIYLDLDRFKLVNESFGFVHGDDLIIAASRRLEEHVKYGDTVARLGGDEFAILLEDVQNAENAKNVSDTLQRNLSAPFSLHGKEIFTTASMGIAHSDDEYRRPEEILRDSELAMYHAKKRGRAQSVTFHRGLRKSSVSPVDLDTDLRRALERNEMTLNYQPIVSLTNGQISGFEALLRWDHKELGSVSPADFIPVAEETGLIYTLGQWVLDQACKQMLIWNMDRPLENQFEISVNLSSRQFGNAELVNMIIDSLDGSGLRASALKLEITESALMENAARSIQMLNQLKELDIKVCIDDFGTGYSSLSYLHTFPIDTLKVDKSFVKDMSKNFQNMEIIRTITMLAHNLRLDVIAEGVESAKQHAQLSALGCQFAQGYYFSRPVNKQDASRLILENRRW